MYTKTAWHSHVPVPLIPECGRLGVAQPNVTATARHQLGLGRSSYTGAMSHLAFQGHFFFSFFPGCEGHAYRRFESGTGPRDEADRGAPPSQGRTLQCVVCVRARSIMPCQSLIVLGTILLFPLARPDGARRGRLLARPSLGRQCKGLSTTASSRRWQNHGTDVCVCECVCVESPSLSYSTWYLHNPGSHVLASRRRHEGRDKTDHERKVTPRSGCSKC